MTSSSYSSASSSLGNSPRVVIMCGGKGKRLRPYTTVLPKPLMPIGDHSILELVLRKLADSGFVNVTLCVGYLSEIIQAVIGNGEKFGLRIDYVTEEKPLGTIGPLSFIDDLGDDFLVMNGDVLTDLNPMQVLAEHREKCADLTIATYERVHQIDFGVLHSNPETGRVTEFVEKPTRTYQVSMGIYCLNKSLLQYVPKGEYYGFDHLVLKLLAENRIVQSSVHRGYWLDIGRLEDYEAAQVDPRWSLDS
ncbi:MAG: sugar phosphate nucleotidyltransferase [Sumerlaeia bacterium]